MSIIPLAESIVNKDSPLVPDISICMVSLNCRRVLKDCLESLRQSDPAVTFETILIDNGSTDGTVELVEECYPEVRLVQNKANVGFLKATNQAIELSSGRYLLWLNPDTILRPDSLMKLRQFMDEHPRAGIAGPKVLNADGTFQPQCKRGLPTPIASLSYMLRLDRRWQAGETGQYLLRNLPEDTANQVDAISGSCLMARREVWDQIGPLDEDMYQWGEDIEWCVRARQHGWEVWYYPESVITHLKGQGGSHAKPYHAIWGMHQGMWIFYKKHLRARYSLPTTALVGMGIGASLTLAMTRAWLKRTLFAGKR